MLVRITSNYYGVDRVEGILTSLKRRMTVKASMHSLLSALIPERVHYTMLYMPYALYIILYIINI